MHSDVLDFQNMSALIVLSMFLKCYQIPCSYKIVVIENKRNKKKCKIKMGKINKN